MLRDHPAHDDPQKGCWSLGFVMSHLGMLPTALSESISKRSLRKLCVLHPALSARLIAGEWLTLIALITMAKLVDHPIFTIFAIVAIGSRQHSLAILMHEGAHYHLSNHRGINDRLAEVFAAWPLFIDLSSYRKTHFEHHNHTNTLNDPDWRRKQNADWCFPKTPSQMVVLWLKVLFDLRSKLAFVASVSGLHGFFARSDWWKGLPRIAYWIGCVCLFLRFRLGADLFMFWLIPYLFVFYPIAHLRSIAEHFGLDHHLDDPLTQTRTTMAGWFESLLICPNHINYHLEHHLAPSVPSYNLPALHRVLMESKYYAQQASITKGYRGVINECMR